MREKVRKIIDKILDTGFHLRGKHQTPKNTKDDYLDLILKLISESLPKEELHAHDSIPCYVGAEDEGCATCIKNKTLADVREKLGV